MQQPTILGQLCTRGRDQLRRIRCTGLIGGSQSGQNTTSRPRTGREVVLRLG